MYCPICKEEVPSGFFCDLCGTPRARFDTIRRRARKKPGPAGGKRGAGDAAPEKPVKLAAPLPDLPSRKACDALAREYVKKGAAKRFLEAEGQNRPLGFYARFARAFLRAGNYETAYALLKTRPDLGTDDRRLYNALRSVLGSRRTSPIFSAAQAHLDRLEAATKVSKLGLHDEAMGLLTDAVIDSAAKDEGAYNVALIHKRAETVDAFVEKAEGKPPEFLRAYARAFDMLDLPDAAALLLEMKGALGAEDYPFYFALRGKAGTLEDVDPQSVPFDQRVRLAQALVEAACDEAAWAVLGGLPRPGWGMAEYAAGLRVCQKLNRYGEARGLFKEIQTRLSLKDSADLHYYFALFCEKKGRFEEAREIYRRLDELIGPHRDVEARLKKLDTLSQEELTRVTHVVSAPPAETGSKDEPGVSRAVLKPIAGRYQILDMLGTGGMGAVFKARDLNMPRDVALKMVRETVAADPRAKALFLEEAKTLAGLAHPCIVSLHDVVESEGTTYLVFEHVEGETIAEIVANRGRLSVRETVGILRHVCEALAFAHARDVVHRDVKPANIMRTKGYVKLMDFGIALHADRTGDAPVGGGTLLYMAPEQHKGKATFRSDVFALGVTAYEMLTGQMPFTGRDLRARKLRGRYEPLPERIPAALRELVASCLKPDPADRPESIRALGKSLAAVK